MLLGKVVIYFTEILSCFSWIRFLQASNFPMVHGIWLVFQMLGGHRAIQDKYFLDFCL